MGYAQQDTLRETAKNYNIYNNYKLPTAEACTEMEKME